MDFLHDDFDDFSNDEGEADFGAFDGEERDLELINAYGIDIEELEEDLG